MPTSFLVAIGGVLLIGVAGFVIAWIASIPTDHQTKTRQMEVSLGRIEQEIQRARDLLGVTK